ncbi:MAG: sigma-70 family RNA polymerase sigma factor [Bacteroidota bacterium]
MSLDEKELLRKIQEGGEAQEEAIKQMFSNAELLKKVIRTIGKMGGTKEDGEDAFQEGFKRFFKHVMNGNFRGESTPTSYFIGICKRWWLDQRKSSYQKRTVLTNDLEKMEKEFEGAPDLIMMEKERKSLIDEMLALLGERCKEVIQMGLYNVRGKEIKEKLNLSSEALVKKIRYRCLKQLRALIGEKPYLEALLKSLRYDG